MALLPEVNKELLLDFIDESLESLSVVEGLFVKLESAPDDLKIIDSIFRPVHSVKGNAAYFGLMRIKELSHRMESILDLVRTGRRRIDRPLCDLLLKGLDALRTILSKVRDEQKEYDDEDEYVLLLVDIEAEAERSSQAPANFEVSREMFEQTRTFLASLPAEFQHQAQALLARLSPQGRPAAVIATKIDTEKLSALKALLSDPSTKRLDPRKESAVLATLDGLSKSATDSASKSVIKDMLDIARTFVGSPVGLDPLAREMLSEKAAQLLAPTTSSVAIAVPAGDPDPIPAPAAPPPPESRQESSSPRKDSGNRTMRITEESMDSFLEQVGELMGLEEQFRYLGKRLVESGPTDEFATDLRQATEQFGHLSSYLSKGVMELRRTEARPLLQKVPRLARDVADRTGKKIEIRTHGEDVRIDKSYLELLDAPLMHMVRNACDHGVDSVQERKAAGKPENGLVEVAIIELEESLVMRVTDDGRGLNMEGLRKKAVELGIVRPEAPFGEAEAVSMLFRSGVSTASEVTEISGRGVGMDVVKREIEGAGGRIEVKTTPGKGSVFLVTLPRSITTRISDGFLFRCGEERFVLPMRTVVETFPVNAAKVSHVAGLGSTIFFRNEILRMVQTSDLLGTPNLAPDEGVYVRVKVKDQSCVIQVSEAMGVQRTVIKPVEEFCRGGGIFSGAAMLGDGRLAMVLGEDGMADWLHGA
ncbi:MAG: chemotaxis protein CheA [Fibrobacterota bacterium]